MNFKRLLLIILVLMLLPSLATAQTASARIGVGKVFLWGGSNTIYDDSLEVNIMLECNDGHDASQEHTIVADPGAGSDHTFVITNFTPGMNCTLKEEPIDGWLTGYIAKPKNNDAHLCNGMTCNYQNDQYSYDYWNSDIVDPDDPGFDSPTQTQVGHCQFNNIQDGGEAICYVFNRLLAHRIDVQKHWIDEQPSLGNPMYAHGRLECNSPYPYCYASSGPQNLSQDGAQQGKGNAHYLQWDGQDAWDSGYVCPHWDGTDCWVTEKIHDSAVESDVSDCDGEVKGNVLFNIQPGEWESRCTVINTRIYEGVPTLSQYGLGVLALLMLGVGMVGFRRFA